MSDQKQKIKITPVKEGFAFTAYAPPLLNFIDVDTTGRGVAECAAQIAGHLQERLSGWGI